MYAERHKVEITTDADGNAVAFTPNVTGRVLGIRYVKIDFADGVDFTLTAEATGEAILALTDQNASGSFYPRPQVHGATGAGLTYGESLPVGEPVVLAHDRVKIQVAQGGNAKKGTVFVIVG